MARDSVRSGNTFAIARIAWSRLMAAALLTALALCASRWQGTLFGAGLFLIGVMLIGIGTVGRLWCSIYISGYKNEQLITAGPYALCRNPLYLFSLVGGLGLALVAKSLTFALAILALFAIVYPPTIRREEGKLARIHGEAFARYCATTPRFWPKLGALDEPTSYNTNPAVYRLRTVDTLWFVGAIGVVELFETLRDLQILPTLARLY